MSDFAIWNPEDGPPPDLPEGWQWITMEEAADEMLAADASRQRLVDLLAWVLRRAMGNLSAQAIQDPTTWPPDLWVTDWRETWWIALRDPLVFDLARMQVAADLTTTDPRELDIFQEQRIFEQAAHLLRIERPAAQGRRPGRRAIELLVRFLAQWTNKNDMRREDGDLSDLGFARELADELNCHPLLEGIEGDALTIAAIRAIARPTLAATRVVETR